MDLPKIKNENLPKELREILGDSDAEFDAIVDPMDVVDVYVNPDQDKRDREKVADMLIESRKKSHEYLRQQRLTQKHLDTSSTDA